MSQISLRKVRERAFITRQPTSFSNTDGAVLAVLGAHGRSLNACRTPYGKVTARIRKSDHDFDVINAFEAQGGECLPEHIQSRHLCRPPSLPIELRMR